MFTQEQLKEIKFAAKKTKNQGELAVFQKLLDMHKEDATVYSLVQWQIIKYCAEECKRQHSGEMSVYDMVNAWSFVRERQLEDWDYNYKLTTPFIEAIGKLVEPIDNAKGFRTIPIGVTDGFGGWIEKAQWQEVPRLVTLLLESYYEGTLYDPEDANYYGGREAPTGVMPLAKSAEDQFYYEYENIHPFVDGNGRSGKILYNYLLGTLDNPQMPPNFWGGSNP